MDKKQFESIFIEVDKAIFKTNRNVVIGELYRPPSSKIKNFNIELEKLLNKIKKGKKYAFLMGDYNINTLSEINRNSNQTQEFINIFSTYYYHKLISLPSRERSQSCSLIDNVYTDIPDCYNTCSSGVLKFLTQSDHYPIFTIRHATETPKPKTHITKRNHSEKNVALFKKCMKQHNWNSLLYVNDIKQTFSQFINTIISYHNRCFPFENKKINYKNRNP